VSPFVTFVVCAEFDCGTPDYTDFTDCTDSHEREGQLRDGAGGVLIRVIPVIGSSAVAP